jgi:hypothetical protein
MTDETKKYIVTLIEDPDDPEGCILPFPEGMLEGLGWHEGDLLNWAVQDDGTVILTKK